MGIRAPLIMSALMLAAMIGLNAWAWHTLPDGMRIATHFDLAGQPNGYAHKPGALLSMPVLFVSFTAFFAWLTRVRTDKMEGSGNASLYIATWMGILVVLCIADAAVVMRARGLAFDTAGDMVLAIALLMATLGNFLGKTTPNQWAGVRTRWTYASDYSWEKSNRLAGKLLVATGLATLAALASTDAKMARLILIGCSIVTGFASIVASYYFWKHDPERQADG